MRWTVIIAGFIVILIAGAVFGSLISKNDDFSSPVLPDWIRVYGDYQVNDGYLSLQDSPYTDFNGSYTSINRMELYGYNIERCSIDIRMAEPHQYHEGISYKNSAILFISDNLIYNISFSSTLFTYQIGNKTFYEFLDFSAITRVQEGKETLLYLANYTGNNAYIKIQIKNMGDEVNILFSVWDDSEFKGNVTDEVSVSVGSKIVIGAVEERGVYTVDFDYVEILENKGGAGGVTPSPSPNPLSPLFPKIPNIPEVGGVSVVWWGLIAGGIGAGSYWVWYLFRKIHK